MPTRKSSTATSRSPSLLRSTTRRAEREHHRPEVAGRVGVRERAADRPEVADDRVGDLRRGRGDRGVAIVITSDDGQLVVSDEGADPERPVALLDRVEARRSG